MALIFLQCKKLQQVFVPPPLGWRDKCAPVAEVAAATGWREATTFAAGGGAQNVAKRAHEQKKGLGATTAPAPAVAWRAIAGTTLSKTKKPVMMATTTMGITAVRPVTK